MRFSHSLHAIMGDIVAVICPWPAANLAQLGALGACAARLLLVGVLCLVLGSPESFGQSEQWQDHFDAGTEAYRRGNYAEAEKQLETALTVAEGFGIDNPELATTRQALLLEGVEEIPLSDYQRILEFQELSAQHQFAMVT